MSASGDPSPLSALTGLTSLYLKSLEQNAAGDGAPFSFSSLQPLSTLQQLRELHLEGHACAATSLQGLSGLSSLKQLVLKSGAYRDKLKSLEGISPGLIDLSIAWESDLSSLVGIESCTSLKKLSLIECGVSSLQPLRGLSSIEHFKLVSECSLTSLEGLTSTSLQPGGPYQHVFAVLKLGRLHRLDWG
jgi:Leucine-rich repeat (LRR) protein